MGSGNSNSNSGLKFAQFESKDDSCECSDHSNQIVEEIEWYAVPTMSTGARVGANIGRSFLDAITLGLAEIDFQGKSLSHDILEAKIYCIKCMKTSSYILEFTKGRTYMICGFYKRYSPIDGRCYLNPRNMIYDNLAKIY